MSQAVKEKKSAALPPEKRRGRGKKLLLAVCALLLAAAVGGVFAVNSLAYRVCRVEAGVPVLASDFIKSGDPEAFFTEKSQTFDVQIPGEYRVQVKSGFFTHWARLIVEDTTPPEAQGETLTLPLGERCGPEALLSDIKDATQVTAAFVQEPDFGRLGLQALEIRLTDQAGNQSTVSAALKLSPFTGELVWEAGSPPPAAEDFLITDVPAGAETALRALKTNHVSRQPVTLTYEGEGYPSLLSVADTVPPKGEPQNVSTCTHAPLTAERFVRSVEDATDVEASFLTEPDLTRTGEQTVSVLLRDEGGNETVLQASLTLAEDTTPPVIQGARDLEIMEGETVSYRSGLRLEDDFPEEVSLEIDSSGVDTGKAGRYQAVYTAEDVSGNATVKTVTVTVEPWTISEEELNRMADQVLEQIFTENMDGLQKVTAIYDYIVSSVRWIENSEKNGWAKAAYEGLHNHAGDCYVYASTAKLLFNRAGITNMDIGKSTASGTHYWNLVDLGDGWYHFDATPHMEAVRIIMWTDQQLMTASIPRSIRPHGGDFF